MIQWIVCTILQSFSMPLVFWRSLTYRNPSLLLTSSLIYFICWLKVVWRLVSLFYFITLVEFAITNHAASSVILPCSYTFSSNYPLCTRNYFISYKPVSFIISLKQTDYLLHFIVYYPFIFFIS